jgi:hypothetical protein
MLAQYIGWNMTIDGTWVPNELVGSAETKADGTTLRAMIKKFRQRMDIGLSYIVFIK